jgi:archaellum component FlaC
MNRSIPFLVIGILLVIVIIGVIVFGLQLSNNITANTNAINDLKAQDTSFKTSLTNFNTQIASISSKLDQISTQLADAKTQISDVSTKQTADATQFTAIKNQLATVSSDIATLKTQTADIATLKADVATLKADVATLKTKANDLQSQIDDLEGSSSSGDYDTLVSNKDYSIDADDGYVLVKSSYVDPDYDGYLYITGSVDPSSSEDEVYVVVIYEDDTYDTISEVIDHQNDLSSPWNNYESLNDYDDDEDIYADDTEPWFKIYLVNTSSVDVDVSDVTVRYYYD